MRGHTNGTEMPYDEQFESYFEGAGLLSFVLQLKHTPSKINHVSLTALLDRWRLETHSSHLPYGKTTVAPEDFVKEHGAPMFDFGN